MARRYGTDIERAIANASLRTGLDPGMIRAFVGIESGGRADARTGSYRGALQLSQGEFDKYGGGNIYSADDNILAGAQKLKDEMAQFKAQYGRDATPADLYLIHQQGWGGAQAHWSNPDQPAWKSMAGTAEGRQKGEAWAKQAIWGNVPDDVKAQYGSVDNITSKQFADLWAGKVGRFVGDGSGPTMTASASPSVMPTATAPQEKGSKPVFPALASLFGLSLPGLGTAASTAATAATAAPAANTTSVASLFGMGGSNGGIPIGETGMSIGGQGGDTLKMANAAAGMGDGEKEGAAPDPLAMLGPDGVTTPQVDMQRLMAVLQQRRKLGTGIA